MAEPIVSFLLEAIGKLLLEEAKFLSGVSDEAEQLYSDLKMMRAMLKDADEKQHESATVKEWVSQSREIAYEAENMLETYAFELASKRRKKGTLAAIKRYTCILNECRIRHKVGLEIQSLNTRVSNLTKHFEECGIIRAATEREGSSSRHQQSRMTYSYVSYDEDFVGFRRDVEKLVEVLVKEDDLFGPYEVVSISGMGGSGKTTLARKVYNHPNVKSHFNGFAWVCISQQWQTRNILQGILVSFLPEKRGEIQNWTDNEIVDQLLRIQKDRKCFVVLDDIWSTDVWECIKVAFPIRRKGNKILLTTRNKDVAMRIGPNGYHHEPKLLTDSESWELLQKKALRDRTGYGDILRLQELGKEMVKFCGGLPLAVVVLGGILATKQSSSEWKQVHSNIKSYLGKGESIGKDQGEVKKILVLSYNDLPYKLRPCFLYLSGFSEDEDINIKNLYHLWIAEGLVSAEDRIGEETMVDIAERYLEELVKRCIVNVMMELPLIRKYKSCRLHDLMRDLCLAKAREENFLQVIDYVHGNGMVLTNSYSSSTGNIHRIMIYLSERDASKYVCPEMEATKHLRALVFSAKTHGNLITQLAESQFNRFKMLRSLTIRGVITPGLEWIIDSSVTIQQVQDRIPDDVFMLPIGNLIHLRYLSLRESCLVILPSTISNLEYLETLDLSGAKIIWTTNVPLRLRRLRYLYLSFYFYNISIHVSNALEILTYFHPPDTDVRHLSELTNLRELGAYLGEAEDAKEIIKFISNSHQLKQVDICILPDLFVSETGTAHLEQLFSSNLQYLLLNAHLGKLPKYNSQIFMNLLELRLLYSYLEEDPMEMLEKLPNLQRLVLWDHAFMGKEMICHSKGFPELRFLVLNDLFYLEKWTVEEGAMANLSHLEMCGCKSLRTVPEGLKSITALKELVLEEMSEEFMSDYSTSLLEVPDGLKLFEL